MTQKKHSLIYGHRGARGLAPENSIPAYKKALELGVDGVDIDVGVTKDGVVVAAHNLALNPDITRDKNGKWLKKDKKVFIKDLTYDQLQQFNIGKIKARTKYAKRFSEQVAYDKTHLPTLDEVIKYVKKHGKKNTIIQIEIKHSAKLPKATFSPEIMAEKVIEIVQKNKVSTRTEIQSFNWKVLQIIQKLDKKIATAYITCDRMRKLMLNEDPKVAGLWTAGFLLKDFDYSIPHMIKALDGKIWCPESINIKLEDVLIAHKLGLKVIPWTVNEPTEMLRMIEFGVDAIITDRPDILQSLIFNQAGTP